MKQLLSLFLFLLPCLAWAQYPSNGNQKITLGEQTTADGLIWRGVLADTGIITPSSDTSAYIILDTANHRFYNYNRATNVWSVAGGGTSVTTFSGGTTGLTPNTATSGAVTLAGTLAVANGGTNRTTMPAGYILHGDGTSVDTAIGLFWDRSQRFLGVGTSSPASDLNINSNTTTPTMAFSQSFSNTSAQRGGFAFYNNSISTVAAIIAQAVTDNVGTDLEFYTRPVGGSLTKNMVLRENGRLGIGTPSPTEILHVVGNARITGAYNVTTGSAANVFVTSDGVLQRSTSSIKYKSDVENYTKGLNEVMKLRPVTYKSINSNSDKIYAGFIAEELADLKLTELYENNDYGEPDAISYAYMVTLLTKAIQEQQEQITLLKKRLLILENK
jgi:hypothetical protein